MKVSFLVAIMITGLLLSVSSAYLNKVVFADDQWSDIAKRQQEQNARAALIYNDKYQFDNLGPITASYAGLSSLSTDETTKGRDLGGSAQMSLENALATFDQIHARWLNTTQNTGYAGLTSVSTDEEGRNRNALLSDAQSQTDQQLADLTSKLQQTYTNMQSPTSTDEKTGDRQAQIMQSWNAQDAQAAALLNQIWQVDQNYVNIQPGATTNENTQGRQLTALQAEALKNGITVFEEIHAKALAATYNTGYAGLTSSTTNEEIVGPGLWASPDRQTQIDVAEEMSLQNAINFYNAYYPVNQLSQPSYSH